MCPTSEDLVGSGMPPLLAQELGNTHTTLTTTGTASTTAATILSKNCTLSTASSQTGAILPSGAKIGSPYYLDTFTSSSTSAVLYPPSGNTINATQTSYTIAQNKAVIVYKVTQTSATAATWAAILTA